MTFTFSLDVGIIFYQDAPGMKRLIESVSGLPFLSHIYAVDGRFVGPDYGSSGDPELSTDLDGIPSNVKLISLPNKKEWQKRQAYIEECYQNRPDFLLILDSDEYLDIHSISDFEKSLIQIRKLDNPLYIYHNVYDVEFIDNLEIMRNTKPRVWYRPYQMEYIYNLNYRNKQYPSYHTDPTGAMYPLGLIKGLRIIHDKAIRPKEYEIKNKEYHKRLVASSSAPTP
jgi:hypothetical protein